MELPGERALFSKLSLQFQPLQQSQSPKPLSYRAKVADLDNRFNLVQIQAKLAVQETAVGEAKISAFVRPDSPVSKSQSIEALLPSSTILKDKVALVIGGSRGLGAAIAKTLALQGCTVFVNFFRSKLEAERLRDDLEDACGRIILFQGDASNLEWCNKTRQKIEQMYGKLDFLICNACPPILPTWLETSAIGRINNYVSLSLALMSTPMASFLDLLSKNGGWNIIISSIYTSQQAPAELPHYVAAKCAIEGMVKVAAQEYDTVNHLIVRPPKLLTDQTNTPLSSQGAINPEVIAVKLVQNLVKQVAHPGKFKILEQW
jgi:NAD(P)-dependent dehydrogenase (short-subunit alcohol dehydrogenase family)